MSALRTMMAQMGLPLTGLEVDYSEQVVGYPGGSYVNKLITVKGPNGRTENFDADMTLKNPQITANEMMSTFNLTRSA